MAATLSLYLTKTPPVRQPGAPGSPRQHGVWGSARTAPQTDSPWTARDVGEGVHDAVSGEPLPHQHVAQTRVLHEHAVLGLVPEDGQDEEGRAVIHGLLQAEQAAVGDEHLHVVVSCGTEDASVDYVCVCVFHCLICCNL